MPEVATWKSCLIASSSVKLPILLQFHSLQQPVAVSFIVSLINNHVLCEKNSFYLRSLCLSHLLVELCFRFLNSEKKCVVIFLIIFSTSSWFCRSLLYSPSHLSFSNCVFIFLCQLYYSLLYDNFYDRMSWWNSEFWNTKDVWRGIALASP